MPERGTPLEPARDCNCDFRVSGYIHKFRLEGEDDAREFDEPRDTDQDPDLSLIVAMWIAVGLLLVIGVLTL